MKKIVLLFNRYTEYATSAYIGFVIIILGLMSAGRGSEDDIFWIMMVPAVALLGFKLVFTKYRLFEVIVVVFGFLVVLLPFLKNREYHFLLSYLAIVGAKNVDFKKIFKCGAWVRFALVVSTMALAYVGLIEDTVNSWMPKYINGELQIFQLRTLGFNHPNHSFFAIYSTALLLMMTYKFFRKWYGIAILSLPIYFMYKVFVCRSGLVMWICTVFLWAVCCLAKKIKLGKVFGILLSIVPGLVWAVSYGAVGLWNYAGTHPENVKAVEWAQRLDNVVTGRLHLAQNVLLEWKDLLTGKEVSQFFDNSYMHMTYNYGYIVMFLFLVGITIAIIKWYKAGYEYYAVALVAMSGYMFMEMLPINIGWDIVLILISAALYPIEKNEVDCEDSLLMQ